MLHRLVAALILWMSLAGASTPGDLISTLLDDQRPVPGRVREHGRVVAAAMVIRRTPASAAESTAELEPAATGVTVPNPLTWPMFSPPRVAADQASGRIAATTGVLGLITREVDDEAFNLSSAIAGPPLSPVRDVEASYPWDASGTSFAPPATRIPNARETFARLSEDTPMGGDDIPSNAPHAGIYTVLAHALTTPLQDWGIGPAPGIDVHIPETVEIIATPLGVSAFQHVAVSGADVFAGITPLGPLAGIDFLQGPVSVRVTGVFSSGRLMTVAALTLQAGNVTVSYAAGPDGGSLSGELINGPVDLTFSMTGAEMRASLAYVLEL